MNSTDTLGPDSTVAEDPPLDLSQILAEEFKEITGETIDIPSDSGLPNRGVSDREDIRLKAVYGKIHGCAEDRSALCLSGGGIRSASFALGIVQGLAKIRALGDFHFLSTVSGGGYLGAWLSSWIRNHPEGRKGVLRDLAIRPPAKKLHPEWEPIRHLRAYSNYLTPRLGFLSADTWTVIALVVRNLVLNWLVLVPLMAAALMIPRIFAAVTLLDPTAMRWPGPEPWKWLLFLSFALAAVSTAYAARDLPMWQVKAARGRDAPGVSEKRFLIWSLLPMMLSAFLLATAWFWLCKTQEAQQNLPAFLNQLDRWEWRCWPVSLSAEPAAPTFIYLTVMASLAGGIIGGLPRLEFSSKPLKAAGAIVIAGGVGGFLLQLLAVKIFRFDSETGATVLLNYIAFAPACALCVALLLNFCYVGAFSRITEDEDREWWARSAGWIVLATVLLALAGAVVMWGPILITWLWTNKAWLGVLLGSVGGGAGLVTSLIGYSARTNARRNEEESTLSHWLLPLGAATFILFLLIVISLGSVWLLSLFIPTIVSVAGEPVVDFATRTTAATAPGHVFVLTAILLGAGLLIGIAINVNHFSLHTMYRNRLIRAYLGASRKQRQPHSFTGFDPRDNIDLCKLAAQNAAPGLAEGKTRLFHVINMAVNLVKGKELAWQERKAESFTASPLHCGSWRLGYRRSSEYGEGITLGTAITISGAAANPNMGYHSSPLVTFLMTLFNVRLGWWLGNPRSENRSWRKQGPKHATQPLFYEALGRTDEDSDFINLSDGGHFDNLGLYEMVMRRCHSIVVVDAGRDPVVGQEKEPRYSFEDLGNAVRKIRIDMGVPIRFSRMVSPKAVGGAIYHCAVGTIEYTAVDQKARDGKVVYIKPVLAGTEPIDIINYAAKHPEFPHETTSDQWFSESQLESYRMLGWHTIDTICGGALQPSDLKAFMDRVEKYTRSRGSKWPDRIARIWLVAGLLRRVLRVLK